MTWPSADNPAAQLAELPPGDITWDVAAREWLVGGKPTPPGRYQRDGERIGLLDPDNPDDLIL